MNRLTVLLGATALTLAGFGAAAPAEAQVAPTPVTVTIDENGNGFVTFEGETIPLASATAPDLGPGGLASVLQYVFPATASLGDVLLIEPDGTISDLVRFNEFGIAFYSDHFEPPADVDATADGNFPSSFYTNILRLPEVGVEDVFNGAVYTPTEGQPGFVSGFQVTYDLISDGSAVPEPATWAMMVLGFGAIGFGLRRRKAARSLAPA